MAIKYKNYKYKNQDEFQEYFDAGEIGLLRGIRTYNPSMGYKISTYLYRCICNEIRNSVSTCNRLKRKNAFGETISLNMIIENVNGDMCELIDLIPSDVNIEKQYERKYLIESIIDEVNMLKEKDVEIMKRFYGIDGYTKQSVTDISKCLSMSRKSIYSRLNRNLKKLKERLANLC